MHTTAAQAMSPQRRKLLLNVFAGNPNVLPSLYMINDMVRADDVLRLLIKKGIVGRNFEAWIEQHCLVQSPLEKHPQFSQVLFYQKLLQALEKNTDRRKLFLVKDIQAHGR